MDIVLYKSDMTTHAKVGTVCSVAGLLLFNSHLENSSIWMVGRRAIA
jgi:hypothetical protein